MEAKGKPLDVVYQVVDEQTGKPIAHPGGHEVGARDPQDMTVRLLGRGGNSCAIRDSSAPIHDGEGKLVGWVVVFHDASQIQAMAQQLTWQASHDALTGLVNRREFERRLAGLIEAARTDNKQHALMYMDLDNFKTVNDTCGHAAGDELLRQLTTVMQARMRGSDTLARLGGDEFGVLLESCPLDQAVRIANGMREAVRDFRFIWQDKTFRHRREYRSGGNRRRGQREQRSRQRGCVVLRGEEQRGATACRCSGRNTGSRGRRTRTCKWCRRSIMRSNSAISGCIGRKSLRSALATAARRITRSWCAWSIAAAI